MSLIEGTNPPNDPIIEVETTGPETAHCFRLTLRVRINPDDTDRESMEVLFHARALVELIYKSSTALCDWQRDSSEYLIERLMNGTGHPGLTPSDVAFLAEVHHQAALVAQIDWRSSVSESEHNGRIAAINRLREALAKQP